jgi:hypothetical protein
MQLSYTIHTLYNKRHNTVVLDEEQLPEKDLFEPTFHKSSISFDARFNCPNVGRMSHPDIFEKGCLSSFLGGLVPY